MRITLETVRQVLREALGRDSFVASFINRVDPDTTCPTADVNRKGAMRYNPAFVEESVSGPEDLFCLIVHELLHPMFGHFAYQNSFLANIAGDTVINATISLLFPSHSGYGSLFQKIYPPQGLKGLLRPGSRMGHSRYSNLYGAFYGCSDVSGGFSTGEVIQTLKVLTPEEEIQPILFLGSHGGRNEEDVPNPSGGFDSETRAGIAEDLKRNAQPSCGFGAGYGEGLYDFFLKILETHMTIERSLLERLATKRKVDRFKECVTRPRVGVTPIPLRPSKRDFVLLASGIPPFHYHNLSIQQAETERGLAVYLDVSGSVEQYLPKIIGLLRSLRTDLTTIFLFSNCVVETHFSVLLQGRIQTTSGTDFDCIGNSLLERGFDKSVILTDGYAELDPDLRGRLQERGLKTLTILFGGKNDCPEFAVFGDVVQLEDVVCRERG